jgi:uncharacterized protein (DUF1684 family)
MPSAETALHVADWRRRTHELYAEVRWVARTDPAAAHALWRRTRDDMFRSHPATPLLPEHRADFERLDVADYDPAWRFELEIRDDRGEERHEVETGTDGVVPFELLGSVHLPAAVGRDEATLDVWRLASYGGGLHLPVKDASHRREGGTYGGGRYLLDTVKGSDLGQGAPGSIVVDLNFAYNPSCAYDPAWACPLAPAGDVLDFEVPVGEMGFSPS